MEANNKRREFLKLATALSGMAAIPAYPSSGWSPYSCEARDTKGDPAPRFKLGFQLFSVRDAMAKDPLATLKALKAMGYQDFEHYGFDADKGTCYGYAPSEFKRILDDLDLTVTSGHYPFSGLLTQSADQLDRFTDQCIGLAQVLKSPYITWPWLDPELRNRDGFKKLAGALNRIGQRVKSAGLGFAYHNHGFEFEDLEVTGQNTGITGYEIVLAETNPDLVKLQLDLYWVMHSSNVSPAEWIRHQPGRFTMWHIKDMHRESRDYTELGNGSIDYPVILPDPAVSGLEYYYIEQGGNYAVDSMESARVSAAYFKERLQQLL